MRGPSHRLRFGAGVALGAVVGVWLAHGMVVQEQRDAATDLEVRKATVTLQALESLLQHGDPREVALGWRAKTPSVTQVRITRGTQLVAPESRRLLREEKPLYDRGQRLATAVQTNLEEGARKAEIEVEWLPGPRLLLAAPYEDKGVVEIETAPLPPPPSTGWLAFVLALLGAVIAFAALALVFGERRVQLSIAAAAVLGLALLALGRWSIAQVEDDRRAGAGALTQRIDEQSALVQSLGGAPGNWDVDEFRKPRPPLAAGAGRLRGALLSADLLALVVLFLAGLGAFSRIGVELRKNRQAYLYIAPAILGMLLLVFYPFTYGITLSFTDSNIYNTSKSIPEVWVGLRNYAEILGQFSFVKRTESGVVFNYLNFYWTLLFTIVWTVCNVALGVSSGLFLALILNTRALALRPLYRVLLILPWALPTYITALIWKGMFHQQFGVINQVLQVFGASAINWFDHPFTSFLAAWTTNAWLSFPFMMVVALGALQSIPADLYEAARVDGASRWQQFRAITLPSLRPALVPAVIISVVWTFNQFNVIFLVTGGDPSGSTEILITQAYKFAFERYRYGYAAAYSTVIFGILLVYGTIQNRLSKATEA
ncbi:MAG: sugar ABC transporter permease [Myxococcales bacterium]|nr:sugar ABC transporter permease [Myxococcales bacterium]